MPPLRCIVVTPEKTVLDEKADFVALPLYDGEIGIGADRAPMIGRLGFGELRLRTGEVATQFFVGGGFVQVADNVVSVLTQAAQPAAEINVFDAEKELRKARARTATTPDMLARRDDLVAAARARVRMGSKS